MVVAGMVAEPQVAMVMEAVLRAGVASAAGRAAVVVWVALMVARGVQMAHLLETAAASRVEVVLEGARGALVFAEMVGSVAEGVVGVVTEAVAAAKASAVAGLAVVAAALEHP